MNLQVPSDAPLIAHAAAATLLFLHIGGGSVGMVSGATAMLARKGERLHRVAGTTFFASMMSMTIVASGVSPFLDEAQWTNTTMGIFTFYLVLSAWATARRGDGEVGRLESVAALIPSGVALMGLLHLATGGVLGRGDSTFGAVYLFSAIAGLAAVCDFRMIRRGGLYGASRIARHVWRMSLALFVAMGSFFLGQQKFLPEEIRGTLVPALPVFAVIGLGLFWFVRVRFPRAPKPTPAIA